MLRTCMIKGPLELLSFIMQKLPAKLRWLYKTAAVYFHNQFEIPAKKKRWPTTSGEGKAIVKVSEPWYNQARLVQDRFNHRLLLTMV